MCKPPRETGGCGSRTQAAAGAEGGSGRGVGGARSSAPRPRPGHRGRCRPPSAQLRRREAEPGVSLQVPGQRCVPAAHPREPRLPESPGRRNGERRRRPLCPRVRGARVRQSARLGGPGECARLAGELRGGGPAPGAPRLAAWPLARSQRCYCTDTHTHRAPPSASEHPSPPLAAAAPRAAGSSAKSRAGEERREPLDFSRSLQPSLVWAAAAAEGWRLHAGKGGDDRGRLLFILKDAFASSQCGFCEPSY